MKFLKFVVGLLGIALACFARNVSAQNDDSSCILASDVEYESVASVSVKPSIKLKFKVNPDCKDVKGYKVYATYNLYDGLYDNHVKYYYGCDALDNKNPLEEPSFRKKCADDTPKPELKGCVDVSKILDKIVIDNEVKKCTYYNNFKNKTNIRVKTSTGRDYYTRLNIDENCNLSQNQKEGYKRELCYYFNDVLLGDYNLKNIDTQQEVLLDNLEYNTTYTINLALVHGNNEDEQSIRNEGNKILIKDNIKFKISETDSTYRPFQALQGGSLAREKIYRDNFYAPNFKPNTKFPKLTRFWRPYTNGLSDIRLEDILYDKWGYGVYYGIIGQNQNILPEELFIYKDCKLRNLDENSENGVYMDCDSDDVSKELIKYKSKVTNNNKVDVYELQALLLAKYKQSDFSVVFNRAYQINAGINNSPIFIAMRNVLRKNGYYNNRPYPLGVTFAKVLNSVTLASLKGRKAKYLKSSISSIKFDSLAGYPLYKDFKDKVLEKFISEAAKLIDDEKDGDRVVTLEFAKEYYKKIASLYNSLCSSEIKELNLSDSYCKNLSQNLENDLYNITIKIKDTLIPSYRYVLEKNDNGSFKQEKVLESKELCENELSLNEGEYACYPQDFGWDLNTKSADEVIKNIAEFQAYQVSLMKEFVGNNVKIASVINGGEAFSYNPSVLFSYDGKDKDGTPYKDFKNCTTDECKDKLVELLTAFSKNFESQQRIVADTFSTLLENLGFEKPYIYYYTVNKFPTDGRKDSTSYLYAEQTKKAFDLNSYSIYYENGRFDRTNKNLKYPINISKKLLHNKFLPDYENKDEYFYNHFSTFQDALYLHLQGMMYGLLKFGYMTGSIGNIGYFEKQSIPYPDDSELNVCLKNGSLGCDWKGPLPTLSNLEEATKDTIAMSRVHAEFSYLDDFLKNSKYIHINDTQPLSESSYIIKNDNNTMYGIIRKENGKKHYLLYVVSLDMATRDNYISLPFLGDKKKISVVSSPAGNLYEIAFLGSSNNILADNNNDGQYYIQMLDNAKTFTLMANGDDSLINMKDKFSKFANSDKKIRLKDVEIDEIVCDANYGVQGRACSKIENPICSAGLCKPCKQNEIYDEKLHTCVRCNESNTTKCVEGQVCVSNICTDTYTCVKENNKVKISKNNAQSVDTIKEDECINNEAHTYTCKKEYSVQEKIGINDIKVNCNNNGCNPQTNKCYETECESNYGMGNRACKTSVNPVCDNGTCKACVDKVYDESLHTCVICTAKNTTRCQPGQVCVNNNCVNKYTCSKNNGEVKIKENNKEIEVKKDECKNNEKHTYTCSKSESFGEKINIQDNVKNCKNGCNAELNTCFDSECDVNFGKSGRACNENAPKCDNGTCVGCQNDEIYDTTSHTCVKCTAKNTSKCAPNQACENNKCVDVYSCSKANGEVVVYKNNIKDSSKKDSCENNILKTYKCSSNNNSATVDKAITCDFGCDSSTSSCKTKDDSKEDENNKDDEKQDDDNKNDDNKKIEEEKQDDENNEGNKDDISNVVIDDDDNKQENDNEVNKDDEDNDDEDNDDVKEHDKKENSIPIFPFLNCVQDNLNGSYNAYFGYENLNIDEVEVASCANDETFVNTINNLTDFCVQPSKFLQGKVNGAFYITFKEGQEVEWSLKNSTSLKTSKATSTSLKCLKVEPYVSGIDKNDDGTLTAHFGYVNNNNFEIEIVDGVNNILSTNERIVPTRFLEGRVDNAFSVTFKNSISWTLDGKTVTANIKNNENPVQGCSETDISTILDSLNGDWFVKMVSVQSEALLNDKNPKVKIRNINASIERRNIRAINNNKILRKAISKLPLIVINCDNDEICHLYDNLSTLNLIERKLKKLRRQVGRTIRQRSIDLQTKQKLLNENKKVLSEKCARLAKIPRFALDCKK